MSTHPVHQMSNKELRAEIEHIAKMLSQAEVGTTPTAGARIIAVMREAARRMRPEPRELGMGAKHIDPRGMQNGWDPETGTTKA